MLYQCVCGYIYPYTNALENVHQQHSVTIRLLIHFHFRFLNIKKEANEREI